MREVEVVFRVKPNPVVLSNATQLETRLNLNWSELALILFSNVTRRTRTATPPNFNLQKGPRAGGSIMGSEQYHNHNTIFSGNILTNNVTSIQFLLQKLIHNVTSTIFFDKIEPRIQHN